MRNSIHTAAENTTGASGNNGKRQRVLLIIASVFITIALIWALTSSMDRLRNWPSSSSFLLIADLRSKAVADRPRSY